MWVATEFNGEIICADSRTVYKGMDIGTAKPSAADQKRVAHWGLDLLEPGERFTAAAFKKYAQAVITDITARGKLPILVGGTGLYIDGVIFNFGFLQDANLAKRKKLEAMSTKSLQDLVNEKGLPMPFNLKNRRHLIRTIETKGQRGSKKKNLPNGVILVGILPSDELLRKRISRRAKQIFVDGVINETAELTSQYGKGALEATGGIVYKISLEILEGKITQAEAIEKFQKADWQYARRQKTWFRRNKFIHWFSEPEQAFRYVKTQLNT